MWSFLFLFFNIIQTETMKCSCKWVRKWFPTIDYYIMHLTKLQNQTYPMIKTLVKILHQHHMHFVFNLDLLDLLLQVLTILHHVLLQVTKESSELHHMHHIFLPDLKSIVLNVQEYSQNNRYSLNIDHIKVNWLR